MTKSADFEFTRADSESFLGYSVFDAGLDACVDSIVNSLSDERGRTRWLACLNPHSYAESLKRPAFASALRSADWLIPDGAGIILASRFLGGKISERVTGSDIFERIHAQLNSKGGATVFFLGSTNQTLRSIVERLACDWPNVKVVGTHSPPFKESFAADDVSLMVEKINDAQPDVLWVGMTAPKQEEFIQQALERLDVRFAAAVGAVFDFYIGRKKRARPVVQNLGLEWLIRFWSEPRRLWRRYFFSLPVFLFSVLRERAGCGTAVPGGR